MKRHLWMIAVIAACKTAPVAQPEPPREEPVTETPPDPGTKPEKPGKSEEYKVTQTAQPQQLQFPEEEFRATQPVAGPPRPFRLPVMKPFTLKNGVKVYLVEQHTLPIISVDLNFEGGSLIDPPGKEGLASVCMSMLTEGTEALDKIQFSEALGDIASSVGSYAGDDTHGVTFNTLSKHLDATFTLFSDSLQKPGFRQSDFDRMISRRIEGVKQSKGNPASVAARVSGAVLYGLAHPFGAVNTEESLKAIKLDDCKALAKKWLQPGGAKLFVVGDLTEQQVRDYFDGPRLASWKGKLPPAPTLAAPKAPKGRIFFVNVPNAAQSQVSMMHFGPKRTAPDYFANSMMAAVFGGGFSSRINMNLREDKGYSYGARGGFSYSKQYGTFAANASVRTDSTYQTLLEIDREVKDLVKAKRPVLAEELEREKQGAILGLPGRFSTGQSALGQYRGLVYFGLPMDYYNTFVDKVGKVTEAQVKASAQKQLKPASAVYVVVGDGNAKVIVRNPDTKKDEPYKKDGKELTLREALVDLAARGDVGAGGFVELDADGKPLGK